MAEIKEKKQDLEAISDIFAEADEDSKANDIDEENVLVNPELVAEELSLKKQNFLKIKEEEEADVAELQELSEKERYEKLLKLLNQSKFYSDFLLSKIQKEDEVTKKIKAEKLKDRKSLSTPSSEPKKRGRKRKNEEDEQPIKKKAKTEARLYEGEPIPEEQPLLLSGGIMRSYQIEGYTWMANLYENGINGILADEMGLGKTIQTIALFAHLVEMGVKGPFLIIAPLSTVPNWIKEIKKFAPLLPAILYHGNAKERQELRENHLHEKITIKSGFSEPRVVRNIFVTSFEIAMNDGNYLRKCKWCYIVVDEGHRLKNTNCKLIRELRLYTSANRLLLTGTPLQNNLDELWSLLNFLMAEIFDDLRVFRSWFNANTLHETGEDEKKRIIQQERQGNILNTLHQILTPFLLRRVKADVDLKIPPKKELLVYCPMTEHQRTFYEATVNKTMRDLVGKKVDESEEAQQPTGKRPQRASSRFDYKEMLDLENKDSEKNFEKYIETIQKIEEERKRRLALTSAYNGVRETAEVRISLKNSMADLRKCTNHPYLIEYPLSDDGVFYRTDEDLIDKCGKMKVFDQMLTELLKRGHKTLIFSQMTRMLDILGDYLNMKNLPFARLDGNMNFIDRQANIDRFNESPDVNLFLLSTRAGGLGINLTAADTCIIYDSDWNPQQDLQAQDRCHRIGQTKPVMIYRLVTANTIDERIVERAAAKRRLEKLIIHHKKFKSQDKAGLTATMEAISPHELLELLNSNDHIGVVDRKDGCIFSKAELDKLLDRSDLTWERIANKENRPKISMKKKKTEKDDASLGLFKVVDFEDGQNSLLQTVKADDA